MILLLFVALEEKLDREILHPIILSRGGCGFRDGADGPFCNKAWSTELFDFRIFGDAPPKIPN
jgi:hypothetical protein